MLTEERYAYIIRQINQRNTITVQELVDTLHHSESTIRRDLSQLEADGELVRVHGGAKRKVAISTEDTMEEKTVKNVQDKQLIAKAAADIVQAHEVIYLDAGTTTFEMIPYLKDKEITVVTNGVPHASLLTDLKIETILLGGKIKQNTKAIIGTLAQEQMGNYRFSRAFLGMNSIDKEIGYTTPDLEEAIMKKVAIAQTTEAYVLTDPSKFGTISFVKVSDIEDCTIITTRLSEENRELADLTRVIEERT
ncbi:DeoR/GlpR family DNA-binding transcription regulator [Marinilactibacillus psychrotolerans]|uniref:DeoR/GlpR family DNA-binding transcription regulator n=1 Tax=Marinilactibacillus psychrotolerans TaxID=191770 RepID=UPI001868DC8A|nr:DeoR/GlpR family DNA-binding transcription regulator [Marinilactibacillus psychrotolerans]GEQ33413.1 DeoR family transcriptional regulator [Marinilactibacillus psychrotolerans]